MPNMYMYILKSLNLNVHITVYMIFFLFYKTLMHIYNIIPTHTNLYMCVYILR